MTRMYRSIINSEEGKLHQKLLEPMVTMGVCPDCCGTRLNPIVLTCRIRGKNIAEVTQLPIPEMLIWLEGITDSLAGDLKQVLQTRLTALLEIGLGYLTLDRGMGTLSGGEAQRCKIAKYINSGLSDILLNQSLSTLYCSLSRSGTSLGIPGRTRPRIPKNLYFCTQR